MFYILID